MVCAPYEEDGIVDALYQQHLQPQRGFYFKRKAEKRERKKKKKAEQGRFVAQRK